MDKIRKEFECFYKDHMRGQGERDFVINEQIESFKGGRSSYGCSDIQEYWLFWQASRAALVVKIPDEHDLGGGDFGVLQDDFARALDEAGISYE